MLKFFFILFTLLPTFLQSSLTTKLKLRQPNWRHEVISTHPNGAAKEVILFEPLDHFGKEAPVKILEYRENGTLKSETDLLEIEPYTRHGPSIIFSNDGALRALTFFDHGSLANCVKTYHPNGTLASYLPIKDGQEEGKAMYYGDRGNLIKIGYYKKGSLTRLERYYPQGKKRSAFNYMNGLPSGECTEWHEDGSLKSISLYNKGLLHSEITKKAFTLYSPEGKVVSEQDFCQGQLVGQQLILEMISEDIPLPIPNIKVENDDKKGLVTQKQTIQEKEGKLHGEQQAFYPNGQLQAILTYDEGVLHGKKMLFASDGTILEEANYNKGKLEETYFRRHPDGSESLSHYKDNLLNGLHTKFYPKEFSQKNPTFGKIKSLQATYKDGRLEGIVTEYNEMGKMVAQTPYKEGKKEGTTILYNGDEKVVVKAEFKGDNQHGMTYEYYPNGALKRQVLFQNDKKQGEEKGVFKNGTLASIAYYSEGLLDGRMQEWNSDGVLIFEGRYDKGKRNGKFYKYDPQKNIAIEQTFENDKLLKKRHFKP